MKNGKRISALEKQVSELTKLVAALEAKQSVATKQKASAAPRKVRRLRPDYVEMLRQFAEQPQTAKEAAARAKIKTDANNVAHRLREVGYIASTGRAVFGTRGRSPIVYAATASGHAALNGVQS